MSDTEFPLVTGYTIKSILDVGGFSTVYLAQQLTLQREVALKVLNPTLADDTDLCKRFLREARDTASVCDHPHIVTVHDVGQNNSHYYIAMEYLRGKNLKHRIDTADALPAIEKTLYQLSSALSHIHQRGFVHRDIKPANVLFNATGDAVLADMGVARMTSRSVTQLTQVGSVVGTTTYMSPEQCRGNADIDARSDLYSLGVIAFEILAGYAPYQSEDPMTLMLKHLQDPIPLLPESQSRFQPMINKLLAKQADDRYASAAQLMIEIQKITPPEKTDKKALNSRNAIKIPGKFMLGLTFASLTALVGLVLGLVLYSQTQNTAQLASEDVECLQISQSQALERDMLLELASVHEAIGRVTHPPGANALEAFTLALEIDPCNPKILTALSRIHKQASDH